MKSSARRSCRALGDGQLGGDEGGFAPVALFEDFQEVEALLVVEATESQRRQYALAESARATGFASVTIIDDDLGRSGSGMIERPGFQKLVASVCAGSVGAVFCIEASRLPRLAPPHRFVRPGRCSGDRSRRNL